MKDTVKSCLYRLRKDRTRHKKAAAVLVSLSLVVALSTTWALHKTGESQTVQAYCGLTEHQHEDSCMEQVLVCGMEEGGEDVAAHVHTPDCYETQTVLTCTDTEHTHSQEAGCYTTQQVLVCGMDESGEDVVGHVHTSECYQTVYTCGYEAEHQHTLSCYSNPAADVESEAVWAQALSTVELTGEAGADLAAIAKTQLGYAESVANYATALDAGGQEYVTGGYTRYGDWAGDPYGSWNAYFVSFCLHYAQVDYPFEPEGVDAVAALDKLSLYSAVADCEAAVGDLVFLDADGDGQSDRVGIVSQVDEGWLKVIEGDSGNAVAENTYTLDSASLLGYGLVPSEASGVRVQSAQCEGYTVTVRYGADAEIPDGAELTVSLSDAVSTPEELEELLNTSTQSLVRLNIGFVLDGQEIEPAQGSTVYVQIGGLELDEGSELNIIHHRTDGTAEVVGDVEVTDGENGTLSFSTDGFSEFDIVVASDETPTTYADGDADLTIFVGESGTISSVSVNVSGYNSTVTWQVLDSEKNVASGVTVSASKDNNWSSTYTLTITASDSAVEGTYYIQYGITTTSWITGTQTTTWYDSKTVVVTAWSSGVEGTIQKGNGGGSNTTVTAPTPGITKTATDNDGDYIYDLALTVSSDVGSSESNVAVDLLFIIDVSGSMNGTYLDAAKSATTGLVDSLATNGNLDMQYAVVTFSGSNADYTTGTEEAYDDAWITQPWTDDASTVKTSVNAITASGGTNYEAGLRTGKEVLLSARPTAFKYVIFLSDGMPGYYYKSNGITDGSSKTNNGANATADLHAQYMVKELAGITGFYTIYCGSSDESVYLTHLTTAIKEADSDVDTKNATASNTEALEGIFADFEKNITTISCTNVTITDTLSDWVEPAGDATPYIVIKVKGEDGSVTTYSSENNTIPDAEQGIEATLTDRVLKLTFPQGYDLKEGYVYEVHLDIQPSEKAIENGQNYSNTADANTGTHAGQSGYYSNNEATLTYTLTESTDQKSVQYPMPVVRVPARITVTKVSSTDDTETLSGAEFVLYKTVNGQDYYYQAPETNKVSATWISSQEDATLLISSSENGTFTINGLADGTYYLLETKAPDGYHLLDKVITITVENGSVSAGKDGSNDITVTKTGGYYTFNVVNSSGYKLPNTGGAGTYMFTMGGLLLMAAPLVYGCGLRRRRERRGS